MRLIDSGNGVDDWRRNEPEARSSRSFFDLRDLYNDVISPFGKLRKVDFKSSKRDSGKLVKNRVRGAA